MTSFISLCGWSDYQHYKDRDPPWVKLHRNLLSSESWALANDTVRVVQITSILLAPRYSNEIPYNFELLKLVGVLKCSETEFHAAVQHLQRYKFIEIHGAPDAEETAEQSASALLAKRSSEAEGKTEAEKIPPVGPPKGDRKRTASKATACPEPFLLTAEMVAWARENTPGVEPKAETAKFVDHWRANRKTKNDWIAAWRNWMRKAQEIVNTQPPVRGAQAPPVTHEQREARELAQLKDRRKAIGLADFRDPRPSETASDYRRAQDHEWESRQGRQPAQDIAKRASGALKSVG